MGFVHLHVHSQLSVLDGVPDPYDIAKRASKLGMSHVALTDNANLFGAVAFAKACKGAGVKPIIGALLYVQPEGVGHQDPHDEEGGYHLLALVEGQAGYQNLCELVTAGIFHGMYYKPRVDLGLLERHAAGLIFLTAGRKGPMGRALARGDVELARRRFDELARFLDKDHLYLELQDHGIEDQARINEGLRRLGAETGYETVVTNAVHYLDPEGAVALEAIHAIATGASMASDDRLVSTTDQAWFKPEDEMRAIFPDDGDALDRTGIIAKRCQFAFTMGIYHFPATTPPDPDPEPLKGEDGKVLADQPPPPDTDPNWAYFYRAFPPPRDFGLPDPTVAIPRRPPEAGNMAGYFRWYCVEGLKLRLKRVDPALHAEYHERLDFEVRMIIRMQFPAYMLIVAEFINWAKDQEIPVGPGRGSAAGSLVAWAMRITDIDPIRFGLLFERFLNPERVSMPDIDVDFCQDRREEVIEHVRQKYGAPLVSQIITYGKLKAKAAVRDMTRLLDMGFKDADRLAKLIPEKLNITLGEAIKEEERLRRLMAGDPKTRRVLEMALDVENLTRQTGVHAAGVVIADRPLVDYAPLYRDGPEGGPVVQYDMKSAEAVGLIKFDFLGLKTLDQVRDALASIRRNHGVVVDTAEISWEDPETYALLQAGDALGVFQLESSGMRQLLAKLKPSNMDDMVALVALYRPGPLESGMVDQFVERKHGRTEVSYLLPMLEGILKPTYGAIVYQEQVMQVAQVMAGYSLGEADLLRRAMGKKDASEMARQKGRFVDGSIKNAIDEQVASDIFDLLAKFAEYGFNKSHSAAYGYISYQTAWLKARYRSEYMAALMTLEAGNTDKILGYIADCRKAGLEILEADLNESVRAFNPVPPAVPGGKSTQIRYGLAAIKGVGDGAIEAIVEAREKLGGKFQSAWEVLQKVDSRKANKKAWEALIKAGAFGFSGESRAALMAGLEAATNASAMESRDIASGQVGLFAAAPRTSRNQGFKFAPLAEWPVGQKLAYEREALGLYLTGHPMQAFQRDDQRYATVAIGEIQTKDLSDLEEVRLLGLATEVRVQKTRRGDKMAFVRLEGADGSPVEVTFFADAYARSQRALEATEPILVSGRPEVRDDIVKILATTAEPLTEVRARTMKDLTFALDISWIRGEKLAQFKEALGAFPGSCRVKLQLRFEPEYEAEIELEGTRVEPAVGLEERLFALFGRGDVLQWP